MASMLDPKIGDDMNDGIMSAKAMFESGAGLNSTNQWGKSTEHSAEHLKAASVGKLKAKGRWMSEDQDTLIGAEGTDKSLFKTFGPKKGKRASLELITSHEEEMKTFKGIDTATLEAEVRAEKQAGGN